MCLKRNLSLTALLSLCCLTSTQAAAPALAKPPEGTVFTFVHGNNLHIGILEFRDGEGKLWPCFYHARPEGPGALTYAKGQYQGSVTYKTETMSLPRGDETIKVLGELIATTKYKDKKGNERERTDGPEVTLSVTQLGPLSPGADAKNASETCSAKAKLTVGEKTLEVDGDARISYSGKGEKGKPPVFEKGNIHLKFNLKRKDLGLTTDPENTVTLEANLPLFMPR